MKVHEWSESLSYRFVHFHVTTASEIPPLIVEQTSRTDPGQDRLKPAVLQAVPATIRPLWQPVTSIRRTFLHFSPMRDRRQIALLQRTYSLQKNLLSSSTIMTQRYIRPVYSTYFRLRQAHKSPGALITMWLGWKCAVNASTTWSMMSIKSNSRIMPCYNFY